ncbi:MAG: hypothetical protein OXU42_17315 [Deltaproteobacteria bacterium]|nr:hypothetical protein [Deltaproteobacteria bacterium]
MNSTRVLLASTLAACVGWSQSVGGQPPLTITHELEAAEYRSFGALSWIRLSTDVFLDPMEAESADVRCFYTLEHLNDAQENHVFGGIAAGNMALSSRLEGTYYVVEPVRIHSAPESEGDAATVVGPLPEGWNLPPDQAERLEQMIEMAGLQAVSDWEAEDYRTHAARNAGLPRSLGVVTSDRAFSELRCEPIVNWSGDAETVGHAGVSPALGRRAMP